MVKIIATGSSVSSGTLSELLNFTNPIMLNVEKEVLFTGKIKTGCLILPP